MNRDAPDDTFTISQKLIDQIVAHSREEAPYECCGMLGGSGSSVRKVYRTGNPDASELTYTIDPKEAFSVIKQMREDNVDFIGCYHSHPATEAYPSPTDKSKAGDSALIYMIVSLREPSAPVTRAYRINDDSVTELAVQVD